MRYLMLMWADADATSGDESDFQAWAEFAPRYPRRERLATSQTTMKTAIAISPMMRNVLNVARIPPAAVTASQIARIAPTIVPMIRPIHPVWRGAQVRLILDH